MTGTITAFEQILDQKRDAVREFNARVDAVAKRLNEEFASTGVAAVVAEGKIVVALGNGDGTVLGNVAVNRVKDQCRWTRNNQYGIHSFEGLLEAIASAVMEEECPTS